jgi:hypothetical protein
MKNTLFILSLLVLFISCNYSENEIIINPFRENKVLEVKSFKHEYKFGEIDTSFKIFEEFATYDTNGRQVLTKWCYKLGEDTHYIKREYVKENNKIVELIYDKRNNGSYKISGKRVSDATERQLEYVSYSNAGDIESKNTLKYIGDKTIITYFNSVGNIISKSEEDKKHFKQYDANGNLVNQRDLIEIQNGAKYYSVKDTSSVVKIIIVETDSSYDYKDYDKNGVELSRFFKKIQNKLPIEEYYYINGEPHWVTKYIYTFYK